MNGVEFSGSMSSAGIVIDGCAFKIMGTGTSRWNSSRSHRLGERTIQIACIEYL